MPPKTGKKAAKATNTAPKTPTPKKNRTPKESPASSSKKRKRNESSAAGETDPEPTNRRTSVRKSADQRTVDEPGNISDLKSFADFTKSEAKVAAYLGYNDIAEWRQFVSSHFFLYHFCKYAGQWSKGLHYKAAFEQISERFLRGKGTDDFPLDLASYDKHEQPVKTTYTVKEAIKRNKRLAHLLILMVDSLQNSSSEMAVNAEYQKSAMEDLTSLRAGVSQPPDVSGRVVKFPKLVTDFPESEMEKYSRAWNMLKWFLNSTASAPQYSKRFEHDAWDQSKAITREFIPTWMVGQPTAEEALPLSGVIEKKYSRLPIFVSIKRAGGNAEHRQALTEHLENEGIELSMGPEPAIGDPRVYHAIEFRDSLRQQLQCLERKLQLSTAMMTLPPVNPDDEEAEPMTFDLFQTDWENMRASLEKVFPDGQDIGDKRIDIHVRFRPLDTENGEECFESTEPPPQLDNLFKVVDDDLAPVVPDLDIGEEGEAERFLKHTGAHSSKPAKSYTADPKKRFPKPGDHQKMIEHYDGFDVTKPKELRAWQMKVLKEVLATSEKPVAKETKKTNVLGGKERSEEIISALEKGVENGTFAAMAGAGHNHADASDPDEQMRYYRIQDAFTGTDAQTGPILSHCVTVMGMEAVNPQDDGDGVMYKCTLDGMDKCGRLFYPYQVTGAAFMLVRLFGTIPLPSGHNGKEDVKKNLSKLRGLQTFGCMNSDYTGLGKTVETLLAAAFAVLYHSEEDRRGNLLFKPILCAVPANAVKGWAKEIDDYWPMFQLAISYDPEAVGTDLQDFVLPASAVKTLPHNREGLNETKDSGKDFSWLFDGTVNNQSTIFLTSHDTQASRFVRKHEKWVRPEGYDPPRFDRAGNEKFKRAGYMEVEYKTKMAKAFSMSIVDEVHELKNPESRGFAAIWLAAAKYHILLSATLMQNSQADIIGPLMMLQQQVLEHIGEDHMTLGPFARGLGSGWRKAFQEVAEIVNQEPNDSRRLVLINARRVHALLRTGNPQIVQVHFHLVDDLLTLRRSAASKIRKDESGGTLSLRDLIKPHSIKTINLSRKGEQELIYQWLHRDGARRYVDEIRGSNEERPLMVPGSGAIPAGGTQKPLLVYPVIPLRDLDLANASTYLARFNLSMRKANHSTLVAQMDKWRYEGMDGQDFVDSIIRPGDRPVKTRADYIKLLCDGSPILVEIFRQIKDYVLAKDEKILITEQVPLNAWHWELAIQLLHIPIATMHSNLDQAGRQKLVDDFNKPPSAKGSLMMLTIMFDVGGQAINLQRNCHRAFVAHSGLSLAKLLQAIGRIIRADQKHRVEVLVAFINNSHSSWRYYRQSSKVMIELATRAHDPKIRAILVELLQERQDECDLAHDSEAGLLMKEYLGSSDTAGQDHPVEGMAGIANDMRPSDVQQLGDVPQSYTPDTSVSKRTRTAPERYNPYHWMGRVGTYIKDPTKRQEAEKRGTRRFLRGAKDVKEAATAPQHDSDGEYEDSAGGSASESDEDAYANHMKQITSMETSEVSFRDEIEQLMAMVKVEKGHTYTDADLNDPMILRRALMLLYRARLGQSVFLENASIHISYNRLPASVRNNVSKMAETTQKDSKLIARRFSKVYVKPSTKSKEKTKKKTVAPAKKYKSDSLVTDLPEPEEQSASEAGEGDEEDNAEDFFQEAIQETEIDVTQLSVYRALQQREPTSTMTKNDFHKLLLDQDVPNVTASIIADDEVFETVRADVELEVSSIMNMLMLLPSDWKRELAGFTVPAV